MKKSKKLPVAAAAAVLSTSIVAGANRLESSESIKPSVLSTEIVVKDLNLFLGEKAERVYHLFLEKYGVQLELDDLLLMDIYEEEDSIDFSTIDGLSIKLEKLAVNSPVNVW